MNLDEQRSAINQIDTLASNTHEYMDSTMGEDNWMTIKEERLFEILVDLNDAITEVQEEQEWI